MKPQAALPRVSGLCAPFLKSRVQILALSMLAGCPQTMLSSHLHPQKAGAGQGTHCKFFLTFKKLAPPSLTPDIWLYLRLIHARAAWSKDLCSAGTEGSPHPAQRLAGESCPEPFCSMLSNYSTSCCAWSSLCHPKQASRSLLPNFALEVTNQAKKVKSRNTNENNHIAP